MARPSGFAAAADGAKSFRAADEAVGAVRCARCAVRTGDLALPGPAAAAGEPCAAAGLLLEALRRLALSLDVLSGVLAEGRRDGDGFGDDFEADALVDWRYAGTRGDFAGVVPLTWGWVEVLLVVEVESPPFGAADSVVVAGVSVLCSAGTVSLFCSITPGASKLAGSSAMAEIVFSVCSLSLFLIGNVYVLDSWAASLCSVVALPLA